MFDTLPIFRLIYDSRSGEVPKGLTGSHEFGAGSRKKVCGGDFLLPRDPCSNPIPRYCPPLYRHSVRGLTWKGKPVLLSCPQLWVPLAKHTVAARFPRLFKRPDPTALSARSSYAFVQIISSFHYTPYVRAKLPSLHGHGNPLAYLL